MSKPHVTNVTNFKTTDRQGIYDCDVSYRIGFGPVETIPFTYHPNDGEVMTVAVAAWLAKRQIRLSAVAASHKE